MKTQNHAAVAITAALSLTAVTMVVWQSRQTPRYEPQAQVAPEDKHADSRPGEPASSPRDPRLRNDSAAIPTLRTQSGLDISDCKWGSGRVFDEQTQEDVWRCSLSSYWDYTTETLEAMAYADAEAARVLAHRVRDTDYGEAILLALRSTALSGNSTPLIEARNWRSTAHKNGDVDLSGAGQAYVLMAVADKINTPTRSRSKVYENMIRQSSDNPDATMQQLDEVVSRMLENIRQIELEITGQITIGEDDDA